MGGPDPQGKRMTALVRLLGEISRRFKFARFKGGRGGPPSKKKDSGELEGGRGKRKAGVEKKAML